MIEFHGLKCSNPFSFFSEIKRRASEAIGNNFYVLWVWVFFFFLVWFGLVFIKEKLFPKSKRGRRNFNVVLTSTKESHWKWNRSKSNDIRVSLQTVLFS